MTQCNINFVNATAELFFFSSAPRHLVRNLPPYTNVSLKMILTNPEGRKESDETIIQTDEDGAIHKAHFMFFLSIYFLILEKNPLIYRLYDSHRNKGSCKK